MSHWLLHRRWATLLALGALLAGCATDDPSARFYATASPHVVETPRIIWADGIEPTSELESHPLVKAARQADLALDIARNTGDYASTLLVDHVAPASIDRWAHLYASQGSYPRVNVLTAGWEPLEILEYDKNSGGGFRVCQLGYSGGWFKTTNEPGGAYDRSEGRTRVIRLTVLNGHLVYDDIDSYEGNRCDGSNIPVGIFDPEPELPPVPGARVDVALVGPHERRSGGSARGHGRRRRPPRPLAHEYGSQQCSSGLNLD